MVINNNNNRKWKKTNKFWKISCNFRMFMCWGTEIMSVSRGKLASDLNHCFLPRENHYILRSKEKRNCDKRNNTEFCYEYVLLLSLHLVNCNVYLVNQLRKLVSYLGGKAWNSGESL
ncbi:unnamed protein product [Brassica rapa]|uniref:Uncharacterized protein n=1 Tax=Brassica campestris TaxID=3711 RepID=A0A8D9CU90_BRACM|nr:unnamed protein product [Brassica rapa]